jgi:hypothetical protein
MIRNVTAFKSASEHVDAGQSYLFQLEHLTDNGVSGHAPGPRERRLTELASLHFQAALACQAAAELERMDD